jgi:hypothetical protein
MLLTERLDYHVKQLSNALSGQRFYVIHNTDIEVVLKLKIDLVEVDAHFASDGLTKRWLRLQSQLYCIVADVLKLVAHHPHLTAPRTKSGATKRVSKLFRPLHKQENRHDNENDSAANHGTHINLAGAARHPVECLSGSVCSDL